MSEKDKKEHTPQDTLLDTQRLLLGLEPVERAAFSLEDILAEYGSCTDPEAAPPVEAQPPAAAPVEPASERVQGERPAELEKPVKPEKPKKPAKPTRHKTIRFPVPAASPAQPEEAAEEAAAQPSVLRADNEIDDISPEELFGIVRQRELYPEEDEEHPAEQDAAGPSRPVAGGPEEPEIPISMEDIVASTVDAVKEEQQKKQAKLKKQLEKERRRREVRTVRRKTPALRQPLPEAENEPPPGEGAARHKRHYTACQRSLLLAVPVLVLLWLPWVLERFGVLLPFFGGSAGNAAMCVLMPQAAVCVLCWPVFRLVLRELRERILSAASLVALANAVTLLDEITLFFLPQRAAVAPLGGVAALGLVFALWGLTGYHRGMWESLRTAAMGEPSYLADCCEAGIAKGLGRRSGFCARLELEDTASQWQRLLTPVLAVASLVFAVLSTAGQGRGQDLLWCWSAVLCASGSLVCPLAYCVPFGRLAARLNHSGAAVAGQYGAAVLSASRHIVVTDSDLFPQGTVALNGLKLYGEERDHAISYAATLVVRGGGCLARVFDELCRGEGIAYQPLEHFHIHDDSGLGGIIHGETVLVGTPVFMRHKAVRLPASMPSRTCLCLAVDGQLTAVFAIKYNTSETVESALRALGRNDMRLLLAVRDGNITPKLLKTRFGTDGGAVYPEVSDRLRLSDPEREAESPSGLIYRDGLYPFVELVTGSRRLCHTVRVGSLLSACSGIFGALLSFYLAFAGSYDVLTPVLLATYLLLWVVPMVPLLWGVDRT